MYGLRLKIKNNMMRQSYTMSQNETNISQLSGGISPDDAKLVDSILNDLGQGPAGGQGQAQGQRPTQGQRPAQGPGQGQAQGQMKKNQMTPQQQQQIQQQRILAQQQQQLRQQQEMAGKMPMQRPSPQMVNTAEPSDIMSDIQKDAKSIIIVMVLCIAMNLDQVTNLFSNISMFVSETGGLNMQAQFVKALLIGVLFFIINNKLL